jgi:pimeloyl-ACP methyl ester carboxylesterase
VPTLIVWRLQDFFFDRKWAYWLRDTIPGAREVIEVEDARLFFPEDRPDSLAQPMLRFWEALGRRR